MVSHHLARFGGYRYCGSEDVMFLMVQEQDFVYFVYFKSAISVYL